MIASVLYISLLKRFYLFIFRDWEREGEIGGGKHQCERETLIGFFSYFPQQRTKPATQACAVIRYRTSDLSLCECVNEAQPTEPHVRAIPLYFFMPLLTLLLRLWREVRKQQLDSLHFLNLLFSYACLRYFSFSLNSKE